MANYNSDKAHDYIRKKILSGEYPPGHLLITDVLSKEIGVSRTPVRDALRMLQSDGLVSIRGGESASVMKMGLTEFQETCLLRLALEGHAAERAALNRTEEDLRTIKFAFEAMRELNERIIASNSTDSLVDDLVREDREDVRFHIAIISAAKNRLLKQEILRLHLLSRVMARSSFRTVGAKSNELKKNDDARRAVALANHEAILKAIEKSDSVAARSEMERHIQTTVDDSLRELAQSDGDLLARELTEEELVYNT